MTLRNDHRRIKGPNTMVSRWRGASAIVDVDFRGVTVLLYWDYQKRQTENLTIGLVGLDWLQGPLEWTDSDIQVTAPIVPSIDGLATEVPAYEVRDRRSDFLAVGPNLDVAENRKLRSFRG